MFYDIFYKVLRFNRLHLIDCFEDRKVYDFRLTICKYYIKHQKSPL